MENEEKQGTTEVSQPNQVQTSENKIGDPQTIMRPNPPEEYKEVTSLLKQLESSTNNLGWVVGLSAINVALIVSGVDLNFLFSASFPSFIAAVGKELSANFGTSSWLIGGMLLSAASIVVYAVCWFFVRKHRSFFIPVSILFLLDTILFIVLLFLAEDYHFSDLIELIFHIWIVVSLFKGMCSGVKIKKLQEKNGILYDIKKNKPKITVWGVIGSVFAFIWVAFVSYNLFTGLDNISADNPFYPFDKREDNVWLENFELKSPGQTTSEDVVVLRVIAERDNARAQALLGDCYLYGWGVEKNVTEAVKWFRKSAEQGNAYGQAVLGNCYLQGLGIEKNLSKAVMLYLESAGQGNAYGQAALGDCYLNGWGVEKNVTEAVRLFQKSAEQGNALGQAALGDCYFMGWGVEKNLSKAVMLYLESAEQGNSNGQASLGACYLNGWGVEKNVTEAKKWLWKSAEQGNAIAIDNLKKNGWW
ncbi:MAG: SEL1-like repeat protein [Lachnospiraceae bacterium]|nr:SEL1-like repeat protein [Lentisphaeria bacterium]MBQ8041170.1 SEL1-like repeat protein [Lachnospiraceae bacterium]